MQCGRLRKLTEHECRVVQNQRNGILDFYMVVLLFSLLMADNQLFFLPKRMLRFSFVFLQLNHIFFNLHLSPLPSVQILAKTPNAKKKKKKK